MPRKKSAEKPRCQATTAAGAPCPMSAARGGLCWRHDPEMRDHRSHTGAVRHKRFALGLGGAEYDKAKVPTIAQLVDRLLDLEHELARHGKNITVENAKALEARVKMVAELRNLITEARDTMWGEREKARAHAPPPSTPTDADMARVKTEPPPETTIADMLRQ